MVLGRRGMMKAGLAGVAGLSLPALMRTRAEASREGRPIAGRKSVILLWRRVVRARSTPGTRSRIDRQSFTLISFNQ